MSLFPRKVIQFIDQPYPYYYHGKTKYYLSLILFVMTLVFTYFFEPFVVYEPEHKVNYFWICFIHSLNPFLVTLILISISNAMVKEENWTIGREFSFIVTLLIMIGVAQFLIRDIIYDNPYNWTWRYFYEEIRNTLLVGFLFALILIPINFFRLNRKYIHQAIKVNPITPSQRKIENNELMIVTQQKSDDFLMEVSQFIFAKADGNYLEILMNQNEKVVKLLKRMTLTELESQLNQVPFVFKTHRSYLVNLQKVKEVKGNAQGYRLQLFNYPDPVPVSRTAIDWFDRKIASVQNAV